MKLSIFFQIPLDSFGSAPHFPDDPKNVNYCIFLLSQSYNLLLVKKWKQYLLKILHLNRRKTFLEMDHNVFSLFQSLHQATLEKPQNLKGKKWIRYPPADWNLRTESLSRNGWNFMILWYIVWYVSWIFLYQSETNYCGELIDGVAHIQQGCIRKPLRERGRRSRGAEYCSTLLFSWRDQ